MSKRTLLTTLGVLGVALLAVLVVLALRGPGRARPEPEASADGGHVVQLLRNPTPMPAFTVTDLDGRTLSSTDLRGKVVLVNFWATWCPPCLAEIPDLIALQDKYRDQLVVVGVSEDEGPVDFVRKFARERRINYPIVMATPELQKVFPGVVALPTTFVLDTEGRVAKKHVGLLNTHDTELATRVLAGLDVDATVERIDDPGRLTVEHAAQITEIPGIDINRVPAERKVELIQALNGEKCTCGCELSVAKCRIDDPTCTVSLPVAEKIVERFTRSTPR
jgi:thiol-disulfide isomerase/thioredoxin